MRKLITLLSVTISIGFVLGTTDMAEEEPCLSKTANETNSSSITKPEEVKDENIVNTIPSLFGTVTNTESQTEKEENDKAIKSETTFEPPSIFGMLSRLSKPKDINKDQIQSPVFSVNVSGNPLVRQTEEPILGLMNRFADKNDEYKTKKPVTETNIEETDNNQANLSEIEKNINELTLEDKVKNTLINIIKSAQKGNKQNKEQIKEAIVGMMNKLRETTQNNEERVIRETTTKSAESDVPVIQSAEPVTKATETNQSNSESNSISSKLHPLEITQRVLDEPEGPTPCTCGVFLSGQFKKGSKDQPKGEPLIIQEMDTHFLNNIVGKRQCTNKCLEMIIKHIPKSSDIICATADRENIYKEKAYLFIKNYSNKWLSTNLSAGREFCCKDNTPYKCPLA